MSISLPNERVYYYDESQPGERVLLCWVPREYLKPRLQRNGGSLKDNILSDFPDGVDVEVSEEEFDDFRTRYNLTFENDPLEIVLTFGALQRSGKVKTKEMIRAEDFERVMSETRADDIIRQVRETIETRQRGMAESFQALRRFEILGDRESAERISPIKVQEELDRNPAIQEKFDQRFLDLKRKVQDRHPEDFQWEKHLFGEIRKSEGDAPLQVFYRLQKQSKGR